MAERPGVMFYFDVRPCLKRLTLEEKGTLFEAMLDYGQFGLAPEFDGAVGVAWDFIQPRIDRDGERYQQTVKARQGAANARWEKQRNANASGTLQTMPTTESNSNPNSNPNSTSKREAAPFAPPTLEEVSAFVAENGLNVDAARFVNYYCANGWKVGKNPMQDWRSSARNWSDREQDRKPKTEIHVEDPQEMVTADIMEVMRLTGMPIPGQT